MLRRWHCFELYESGDANRATSLAVHTLNENADEGALVLPLHVGCTKWWLMATRKHARINSGRPSRKPCIKWKRHFLKNVVTPFRGGLASQNEEPHYGEAVGEPL